MKEIGGYLELEQFSFPMLHEDALALNSGSHCLTYLIRAKKIQKLAIPFFMCSCVENVCKAEGVDYRFYSITETFMPDIAWELSSDEWLYLVDFYGQLSAETIKMVVKQYERVIVDQVHGYFEKPIDGIDTIYSCRKFFGVPDGAFLYTSARLGQSIERDLSYDRLRFLGGRLELSASDFYSEFQANEAALSESSLEKMSKTTMSLLHGIDYARVFAVRSQNFKYLHERLKGVNLLGVRTAAFMYPLLIENGALVRHKLIEHKVYIPALWPNVLESMPKDSLEYRYADNILPLPVDQRYGIEEMEYMCKKILNILG